MEKEQELQELIEDYGNLDEAIKKRTKELDTIKAKIKNLMEELVLTDSKSENFKANYIIQHRQKVDEDSMLSLLEEDWLSTHHDLKECDYIKTKTVLDMDKLENALFNEEIAKDVVTKLNEYIQEQNIPTLKITRSKK